MNLLTRGKEVNLELVQYLTAKCHPIVSFPTTKDDKVKDFMTF
jgi:hypothetical protein